MIDNIIFEKIYMDYDFYEIRITCRNEVVTTFADCYVNNQGIHELSQKIDEYVSGKTDSFSWSAGDCDEGDLSGVVLNVFPKDKYGHLYIQVMTSESYTMSMCNKCCLYIHTELGLLNTFGNRIKVLNNSFVG